MRAHGIKNYTARQKKKTKVVIIYVLYTHTYNIHITYMFRFDVLCKQIRQARRF